MGRWTSSTYLSYVREGRTGDWKSLQEEDMQEPQWQARPYLHQVYGVLGGEIGNEVQGGEGQSPEQPEVRQAGAGQDGQEGE